MPVKEENLAHNVVLSEAQPKQDHVLGKLFANWLNNSHRLDTVYFAYRLKDAPNCKMLYRFLLANGRLVDVEEKLVPKYDKEHCRVVGTDAAGYDSAKCSMYFEGLTAEYFGIFSYGANVEQTFRVTVNVTKLHQRSHPNPVFLEGFVYNRSWCPAHNECLDCKVIEFDLSATTTPLFKNFKENQGRDLKLFVNETVVDWLWVDFVVGIYSHIKPVIREALIKACRTELSKRWLRLENASEAENN